jgi:hypothetical protein
MTAIFTVTTLRTRKPETEDEKLHADGKDVIIASARTPGFYPTLALAKSCVEEDWLHISECYYDHAVIEEVTYALYSTILSSQWYRWDKASESFRACGEPNWLRATSGGFVFG